MLLEREEMPKGSPISMLRDKWLREPFLRANCDGRLWRRGEEIREQGQDPKWAKDTEKRSLRTWGQPWADVSFCLFFVQSYWVLTAFWINQVLQIFDVWKAFSKDGVWKPGSEAPGWQPNYVPFNSSFPSAQSGTSAEPRLHLQGGIFLSLRCHKRKLLKAGWKWPLCSQSLRAQVGRA